MRFAHGGGEAGPGSAAGLGVLSPRVRRHLPGGERRGGLGCVSCSCSGELLGYIVKSDLRLFSVLYVYLLLCCMSIHLYGSVIGFTYVVQCFKKPLNSGFLQQHGVCCRCFGTERGTHCSSKECSAHKVLHAFLMH